MSEYLPVFVEPVICLGLDVQRVAEVRWPGRRHPELLGLSDQQVVDQLLVLSLVVLLHDAEAANWRA